MRQLPKVLKPGTDAHSTDAQESGQSKNYSNIRFTSSNQFRTTRTSFSG